MLELIVIAALALGATDQPTYLAQAKPAAKSDSKADGKAEASAAKSTDKAVAADGKAAAADGAAPAAEGEAKADGAEGAKPADTSAADAAPAEGSPVPGGKSIWDSGALGYMIAGGFFMWPLLALGILAAGAIVERYRSLKMLRTDTEALRARVAELLRQNRIEEAYELCESQQGPVPAVLAVGLRKFLVLQRLNYDPGKIEEQVVKAMDDYGVHIVAALERHLPILATVSSVGPMIGFLGTVQGMVISFQDIVDKMGETNIVMAAADGIKVSLLTTVLGLIVGIPAYMAFNYYTGVINRFVLEVEESASELIEVVTLQMTLRKSELEAGNSLDDETSGARPAYQS